MKAEMAPRFEAGTIEDKWYAFWADKDLFKAVRDIRKKPYTIMMPPPNITGVLHMGHALNNTLQDIMARFKRLQGYCVLWQPGTDHAGIATQAVVEKKLWTDKKLTRQELGRDKFIESIWEWREQHGGHILKQLHRLGCSCDWSRTRFTLDEGLSRAVREAFVRLFNKGLIYRGARMINWDCKLETAVSDDEMETTEVKGSLWYIRYPIMDTPDKYITVATTRPETMFGDTGVAVNPRDERYSNLIGKHLMLPIVGRELPVVADETVDPEFGTGAVKVTPAHDPADYERGRRFNLPIVNVLNKNGTLNEHAGKYAGKERFKARKELVEELDTLGLLERVEDHTSSVPHSDRSKTPIEPMISEQWFVRMQDLAAPAIAAVKPRKAEASAGDSVQPEALPAEITFVPDRFVNTYLQWLENVQDWCISRQLVWGHRIPVWYDEDGESVALLEDPAPGAKHPKTGRTLTRQDEDVLDTWASSWLWPFSTLGWPAKTADLDYFYPTNFLSTDRGIIYLWVARMVMAGYEFLGEPPFRTVYIHATVLDEQGRRMSKSLGNGIDPIEMIDKWGVDAVRLTLPLLTNEGQDIKLAPTKFEMGRNFCNKLWNASRLVLGNLGDFEAQMAALSAEDRKEMAEGGAKELEDAFIQGKLTQLIVDVTDALERHKFNDAANALYRFTWDEFCDWYLEVIKPRLYDKRDGDASRLRVQAALVRVLDTLLTMLHPIIPFVTEEIWQNLRPMVAALHGETPALSLAISEWPKPSRDKLFEPQVRRFDFVREVTRALRNVRSEHNIERKTPIDAVLRVGTHETLDLMGEREVAIIKALVNLGKFEVGIGAAKPQPAATVVLGSSDEVYVALGELIDYKMELLRLEAARAKLLEGVNKIKSKLENLSYVERAPAAVVQKDRERLSDMALELERTDKHLAEIRKLAG